MNMKGFEQAQGFDSEPCCKNCRHEDGCKHCKKFDVAAGSSMTCERAEQLALAKAQGRA